MPVSILDTAQADAQSSTITASLHSPHLKGISLLPRHELGAYKQMPYEAIDEKTYNKMISKLGKLSFGVIKHEEAEVDKFCNNDSCEIVPMTGDNDDQEYAN